jgi:hypothetical protein
MAGKAEKYVQKYFSLPQSLRWRLVMDGYMQIEI